MKVNLTEKAKHINYKAHTKALQIIQALMFETTTGEYSIEKPGRVNSCCHFLSE